MGGSKRVCVFGKILWVGPKECVCVLRGFVGGSEGVCVYCEVMWVGPKECVCTAKFCGWVRRSVCVI